MIFETVSVIINLVGTSVDIRFLFGVASFSASMCESAGTKGQQGG